MKKFARNTSDLQHAIAEAVHAAKHINHTGFQKLLNIATQDLDTQDLGILFQRFIHTSINILPEITIVVIMFLVYMFVQK